MPRRALKVCAEPGCPELTDRRHCAAHAAAYERQRGTPAERGYGPDHLSRRNAVKPAVERGEVSCARCRLPIAPDAEWALDHNDERTGYLGASHKICNDRAGGIAAHR